MAPGPAQPMRRPPWVRSCPHRSIRPTYRADGGPVRRRSAAAGPEARSPDGQPGRRGVRRADVGDPSSGSACRPGSAATSNVPPSAGHGATSRIGRAQWRQSQPREVAAAQDAGRTLAGCRVCCPFPAPRTRRRSGSRLARQHMARLTRTPQFHPSDLLRRSRLVRHRGAGPTGGRSGLGGMGPFGCPAAGGMLRCFPSRHCGSATGPLHGWRSAVRAQKFP